MSFMKMRMPVSYYMMKYVILIVGVGSLRFAYRILRMLQEKRMGLRKDSRKNTMVVFPLPETVTQKAGLL